MLDSSDIDFIRETIEELLPDTCDILAPTNTSDGQGGIVPVWGTVSASVSCRLDPGRKMAIEAVSGAALQPFDQWILTLPHGTTIEATYRVECNGATFNVESVDGDKSWKGSVRATLKKL